MTDYLSEWYRREPTPPYRALRCQIIEVEGGFARTNVGYVGEGPDLLPLYTGGPGYPGRIYPTLAKAERALQANDYSREMPPEGRPERRRRSGPSGSQPKTVRSLRVPEPLWSQFTAATEAAGSNCNAVANQLIAEYVDRETKA